MGIYQHKNTVLLFLFFVFSALMSPFIFSFSYLCSSPSVFNLQSREREVLCQSYRDLVAAQLDAGRSEEEHAFGIKKRRAALDIGE